MKLTFAESVAGAVMAGALLLAAPRDARADDGQPAAATAAPVTAPASSDGTSAATTTTPAASGPHRTVWPWVIMGAGVALLGTALVFEIASVNNSNNADDEQIRLGDYAQGTPQRAALQAQIDDNQSSESHERTAAIIFGTAGFLTVAGSVMLWFIEGSSSTPAMPPPAAGSHRPLILPTLAPGYAGGTLGGTF